jgi:hypothetical protein
MSIENTGKVTFGNFSIGSKTAGAKKDGVKDDASEAKVSSEVKNANINPEAVLDTLDIQGAYNRAQVVKTEKKEVNPADYLSEERISDIEAMMDKFENGVQFMADNIKAEFPSLSDDSAYALAAKMFAAE